MENTIISDTQTKMKKAVDYTLHEFSNIHTGKANPSMVEGIMVDAYGASSRIKDIAAITTPDARQIVVQPWDKSLVQAIVKGIQVANVGFNPRVDGGLVRIPLPEMSRERREEFVKVAHRLAEEGRVNVRNVRRDCLEAVKKIKASISEDDAKRMEKEIQNQTDKSIAEINKHLEHKEKELMTV